MIEEGDKYLTPREVADLYPDFFTAESLAMMRWRKKGPPYIKVSGFIKYQQSVIERAVKNGHVYPSKATGT